MDDVSECLTTYRDHPWLIMLMHGAKGDQTPGTGRTKCLSYTFCSTSDLVWRSIATLGCSFKRIDSTSPPTTSTGRSNCPITARAHHIIVEPLNIIRFFFFFISDFGILIILNLAKRDSGLG